MDCATKESCVICILINFLLICFTLVLPDNDYIFKYNEGNIFKYD